MSWHQDDSELENDLEDAYEVVYLIRHHNKKLYEAFVVDKTEGGGIILEVEEELVQGKLFPERYLDSRFLKNMGYELFIVPRPNAWSH